MPVYLYENLQLPNCHIMFTHLEVLPCLPTHLCYIYVYLSKSYYPLELISSRTRKKSAKEQVHFITESSPW